MRGPEIDKIRNGLGLSHQEFARFLGIALSTSYRWVKTRAELRVDPIHLKILTYIQRKVFRWSKERRAEMIAKIKLALDADPEDGTLKALAALLSQLAERA
jgi:predicted transcriptional regulator